MEFLIKDHLDTFLDLWALVYLNPSPRQFTTRKSQACKIKYWEEHTGKYNFPWWNSKAVTVFFSFVESFFKHHCLQSMRKACAPCMRQDEAGIYSVTERRTVPDVHFLFTWWNVLSGAFGKRLSIQFSSVQFSSVQSLSHVRLFVTPWTAAHQASLSITSSQSWLKLMSFKSVMLSNHLILCCPFSSCLQSFLELGSFPMSQFFTSGSTQCLYKDKELTYTHYYI